MAGYTFWPRLIQLSSNKLIQTTPKRSLFIQSCLLRENKRIGETFKLRFAYGDPPILSDQEFNVVKEENQLTELSFKPIRFAKIDENNSPLYDHTYEVFLRNCMRSGKKDVFEDLMNETFYLIKTYQYKKFLKQLKAKEGKDPKDSQEEEEDVILDPMEIFRRALENCKPLVITRKIRRGGAIYQVPFPLDPKQSEWYSYKWLIASVLDRPRPRKRRFFEAMAQELLDAAYNRGKVIKKRDDMHKLAEANKAYSHYRWG